MTSADKDPRYKIVCISMYKHDISWLDEMVRQLKLRGHSKVSKSSVIRYALDQLDIGNIPRNLDWQRPTKRKFMDTPVTMNGQREEGTGT